MNLTRDPHDDWAEAKHEGGDGVSQPEAYTPLGVDHAYLPNNDSNVDQA